ncbi:MAG: NAD(P)H-quinone oxidoreductase subunit 3 [Armatimonadetes bacterium]|nr:NAD(P)H-quinone oxidoreductase subunit 3 [Armatimonadota bacterium]
MLKEYFPILLMLVLAIGFGVTMIFLSSLAGRKTATATKTAPYECGSLPVGSARLRFDVKFYVVAILFILFDVEAVLLWPWAVLQAQQLKLTGLVEAAVFVGILLLGYLYALRKGALEWE